MEDESYLITPEELVNKVLDEASASVGTWSFAFIKKLQEQIKFFNQKKIDKFVDLLLIAVENDTFDNNVKFKIAQLLSTLRSFFLPGIISSLNTQTKRILHITQSIRPGSLSECTRKMYMNLIQTNIVQPASYKVKSSSVGPQVRMVSNLVFETPSSFLY